MSDPSVEPRMSADIPRPRNHVLAALPAAEFAALLPDLERVPLLAKQVLSAAGEPPVHVYFPEGGILSFTLELPSSGPVEFGIVGREGLSSFAAIRAHRVPPVRSIVQIGGHDAHRIRSERLRAAMERGPALAAAINDVMYGFMGQMAFTAVSNARHSLAARLSRWLLLCDDRLDTREVPLTHEFMAMMLGVQRTSVTLSLHVLEGEGAIRSRRGAVLIVDRRKLLEMAGEAYLDPRRQVR